MGYLPSLFGTSNHVLNAALNGLAQRHEAIAGNVANASTPGYQAKQIHFEADLAGALAQQQQQAASDTQSAATPAAAMLTSEAEHFDIHATGQAIEDSPSQSLEQLERMQFQFQLDPKSPSMDHEMSSLARNTQKFVAVSRLSMKRFDGLRQIIKNSG